jgi:hypothetical protein
MHDPRVGRFFARDPLEGKFPFYSPYQFSSNTPISAVELEGLETSNNKNLNEETNSTDKKENSLFEKLSENFDTAVLGFSEGLLSMLPSSSKLSMFTSPEEMDQLGKEVNNNINGVFEFTGIKSFMDYFSGNENIENIPYRVLNSKKDTYNNLSNNISTSFGRWFDNVSSGNLYRTSYAFGQFTFTASSFYGTEITTADGFLFGSISFKTPFSIPVQRFGNMSIVRQDFWGPRIGSNVFINRAFAAIKPKWNNLSTYTLGKIPKGTVIEAGIVGPQSGGLYPGGSIQFKVLSKEVIEQQTRTFNRSTSKNRF